MGWESLRRGDEWKNGILGRVWGWKCYGGFGEKKGSEICKVRGICYIIIIMLSMEKDCKR